MISLIITLIACVAAIACCFLTLNAKINKLRACRQLDRESTGDALDSLLEAIKATFEYVRAVDRADQGTYLRRKLKKIEERILELVKFGKLLDERLLAVEYPAIREAQQEVASDDEESAIDASAGSLPLREFIMVYGKENLMTHAELVKDMEMLFEKLFDTATRVEELEMLALLREKKEKKKKKKKKKPADARSAASVPLPQGEWVRADESGQYAPLAKPADDKPRSHTGKERQRSKKTDYRG